MTPDLATIPHVEVRRRVPLAGYTRFGIGGAAEMLADASDPASFTTAFSAANSVAVPLRL